MAQTHHIQKVAIIGAGGNIGSYFVEELLKSGKHTISTLVRQESKSNITPGVKTLPVDYDDEESIISALRGQQFLIITLSVRAPRDLHGKIIEAAIKAGVPYIMPSTYGTDIENRKLAEESLYGSSTVDKIFEIEKLGAAFMIFTCGCWYEWSLAVGEQLFGFSIKDRKVTFYDDGKTVINSSTWRQCGRALAALLSLPESDASPALSQWKNKSFYVSSFRISQRDILDSLHRVIGTTDSDWEISYEPTAQRYANGLEEMRNGQMLGFPKALYARIFYPNGDGDFESSKVLANGELGLPKEEIDEATRRAVNMVESGWNPFA